MLPQNIEHVAKLNAVLICPMKSDMNAPMKLKLHPAERLIIVPNIIFSLMINHLLSFFRVNYSVINDRASGNTK